MEGRRRNHFLPNGIVAFNLQLPFGWRHFQQIAVQSDGDDFAADDNWRRIESVVQVLFVQFFAILGVNGDNGAATAEQEKLIAKFYWRRHVGGGHVVVAAEDAAVRCRECAGEGACIGKIDDIFRH